MDNGKYFYLNRECILHKGINGYAIYDLGKGDIISLSYELGVLLEATENGQAIQEVVDFTQKDERSILGLFATLSEKKLGNYYPNKIYFEKFKSGKPYERFPVNFSGIQKCFVEFPGNCQANCSFCGLPTLFPCYTCHKITSSINISLIENFLSRIFYLNCRKLIFHGGDPISNKQQFLHIVKYCRELGYEGDINVVTNGILIDEEIINIFSKYHIIPIIPLFSDTSLINEQKIREINSLAHSKNVKLIFTVVTIESNPDTQRMNELISQLSPLRTLQAGIYNVTYSNNNVTYPLLLNTVARINATTYYHNKWVHPCLWGTIAINCRGDILPCPHLENYILDNIANAKCLENVFENEDLIFKYWEQLYLSNIPFCKDCEFNHGCIDCRAFEVRLTGDLVGKRLCSLGRK